MTSNILTARIGFIKEHALQTFSWQHHVDIVESNKPSLYINEGVLAIFESGGLASFERTQDDPVGWYRLNKTVQFQHGDKIEVNKHTVRKNKVTSQWMGETQYRMGYWLYKSDPYNEQASGLVILKEDGSMTQLINWYDLDDVLAANTRVEINKLLISATEETVSAYSINDYTDGRQL